MAGGKRTGNSNGKGEKRIPPLRCGITNKRTGNGKDEKQVLRLRRKDDN
jgi:hypothetical protein